ncbi:MAG: hypothetical protein B7C54_10810 [Acidimicrobiales bacterium mtb01]|nr:class I SAM-dependent RNA methyltransferase [Actinomycetota bacterium]TEX45549.1 MAG: hypothetical protein B7C54_10810 [Acidimicrobiales bacterium mtb01]
MTEPVVRIEKVVAEGDGLGRLADGRVVFVEGGLPGELVTIRIVKQSRDYARAVAVDVIEANVERIEPPCPHVSRGCGGCDLQHATIELQRRIKVDIVRESLVRIGRLADPDVGLGPSHSDPFGYRATIRVARAVHGRVGFRRRSSHDVVAVTECPIAHPALNEILENIRVGSEVDEIAIRASNVDDSVTWWAEPDAHDVTGLPDRGGPSSRLVERVLGRDFVVSAGSFFQSSPAAAAVLVESVRRALGDPGSWSDGDVVDAYSGIGLFAALAVPTDRHVWAIESNPWACADARENLSDRSATIVESRVDDWQPRDAAVVIADPARDGLRASGVEVLANTGAAVIVLVSCDPASLGRDARLLDAAGYAFERCEVLDLFPQTHHVEAVSRFVRRERL